MVSSILEAYTVSVCTFGIDRNSIAAPSESAARGHRHSFLPQIVSATRVKGKAQIPLGSLRHISTRRETFDVSSASRRACRAVLFDKLDTAKMHGLDTSNVSTRNVTCQVEFGLKRELSARLTVYRKVKMVPRFKEYDRDGNGYVSLDEATSILQSAPFNFPASKVGHLLQKFDKDGNGKLDIEEFADFYAEAKATYALESSSSRNYL